VEQQVVDLFVDGVRVLGLPGSVGEIYGLLFISREPLSLDDLVRRLKISKGSASQGLRALKAAGIAGGGLRKSPKFPRLKSHAAKHSSLRPGSYYQKAQNHTKTGKKFKFRHDRQNKNAYVTRTGPDSFTFTSTNESGSVIFTHIDDVNSQYLRNLGITLPEGY